MGNYTKKAVSDRRLRQLNFVEFKNDELSKRKSVRRRMIVRTLCKPETQMMRNEQKAAKAKHCEDTVAKVASKTLGLEVLRRR